MSEKLTLKATLQAIKYQINSYNINKQLIIMYNNNILYK